MIFILLGGIVGILAFCLIYGGMGWFLIEIDHRRKCRQIRREWERRFEDAQWALGNAFLPVMVRVVEAITVWIY